MKRTFSKLLPIFLTFSTAHAGEFKLPVDKAKQYADLYCKNLDIQNNWIRKLNELSRNNNLQLRIGSFAEYLGKTSSIDKAGKQIFTGTFSERWTVLELRDGQARIEIIRDGRSIRVESRDLQKAIFNATLTVENPVNCLMWANFAAEIKETKVDGRSAIIRTQSVLGNVEPVFTYAESVPFDLAVYKETTLFDDRKEITGRELANFKF